MKMFKIKESKHIFFIGFFAVALIGSGCKKDHCKGNLNEKVFVANEESGTVSVIDVATGEVIETLDLDYKGSMYMAHNIQSAPNHQTVWVTAVPMKEGAEEYAIVMDSRREGNLEFIPVGSEQHVAHVVLDDESEFAYVTGNESGQVIKIDTKRKQVVERIDLGELSGPHGLRFMDGKLYVACMTSSELAIVDVATSSVTKIPMGGIAVQTAVLPILQSVFVSVYDLKEVVRYDISTGDTTRIQLPVGSQGPIQLYPSPDNSKVYVCDQGIVNGNPASNKLYVIDTYTNQVISTVTVGNGAHGVVTSIDGSKIFVTNLADNTVSVIDAATLTVDKTIDVGISPNGITTVECKCDE